jgi:hypothetical protein
MLITGERGEGVGARGYEEMSSNLGWPIAPTYTSPMRGRGEFRGLSHLVQLWHGAQINMGDLTPYLTYGWKTAFSVSFQYMYEYIDFTYLISARSVVISVSSHGRPGVWDISQEYETFTMSMRHYPRVWDTSQEYETLSRIMMHIPWLWDITQEYETLARSMRH